ncbi:hypothetical protein [Microcystis sp. M42BS1]|uniref:hypothetical protein n=1 Tax=Microcystis sp. M42BS1 TaxID=2771192 RepID=UPI0025897535|nr:hypothetical protein [Microcystis sp. M42BS1]MCA2570684.1 hypothetical protein [Microcystis sp. M42BS1]
MTPTELFELARDAGFNCALYSKDGKFEFTAWAEVDHELGPKIEKLVQQVRRELQPAKGETGL